MSDSFNIGDYVYYTSSEGDTIPCVVNKLMSFYMYVDDGQSVFKVKKTSCRLQ